MSLEDIKLKKVDEPDEAKLPPGIFVIKTGNVLIFVRRVAGRFTQVSKQEENELWQLLHP